jgi:hypothetical protein
MCAAANFLGSVHCVHAEFDMTPDDAGHFAKRDDATAHESHRKMMPPNHSLSTDTPCAGLRPRSGPPVSLIR